MEWVLCGVVVSILVGVVSELNRRFQLDGFRLNFWRSLVMVTLLAPIAPFVQWPEAHSLLYPVAILGGCISVFGNTIRLNLAASHNGRVATLFSPIKTFTLFLIWLLVDAASWQRMVENPLEAVGVLCMFVLAAYSLMNMRKNDHSWQALLLMAPVGFLYAVNDAFGKMALDMVEEDKWGGIVAILLVGFSVSVMLSGSIMMARRSPLRPICPPGMLKAGVILGAISVVKLSIFYYGMVKTPNPSYLAAIMMLTPVWFLIYHRIVGVKDDASPVMGTLMVLSAIGLVIITNN